MATETETLTLKIEVDDAEAKAALKDLDGAAKSSSLSLGAIAGAAGVSTEKIIELAGKAVQFGVDAFKAYVEQNKEAKQASDALNSSLADLKVAFGGAIAGGEDATKVMLGLSEGVDQLTASVQDNAGAMDRWRESIGVTQKETEALNLVGLGTYGQFSRVSQVWELLGEKVEASAKEMEVFRDTTLKVAFATNALNTSLDLSTGAFDQFKRKLGEVEEKWDQALNGGFIGDITGAASGAFSKSGSTGGVNPDIKRSFDETLGNLQADIAFAEKEKERIRRENQSLKDQEEAILERSRAVRADFERAQEEQARAQREESYQKTLAIQLADVAKQEEQVKARTAEIAGVFASTQDQVLGLAASMGSLALQTLIAGDSFKDFGLSALQGLGDFAVQAGQVMLFTGLGLEALFAGNPVAAIVAGSALIAVGSVLSGLAKRNLKGSEGRPSASTSASISRGILDSFASRNPREQEDSPITVIAQFGSDRLEPTVTQVIRSAQRNGRLPTPRRA